ncbi:hypothetical protein BS78_06G033500 [Paspalum vaginatum]|nr:hypothetical protein BS78_06G033500 [Paspalum vaginatum]
MEITVHSSKSVKPDYGDHNANGGAHAASADVVPLTVFDKVSYDEYITGVCAFRPPAPPNDVLEAGLATALAEYREWAGRLGADAAGNRAIMLADAGARYVEATADTELSSSVLDELTTGANLLSLYPSCDGAEELLLAQVTRFRCGAIVVGVSLHHKVADGHAIWAFLFAWGQATRGVAVDPVPVHDRASLFAPRDPPRVEFDHRGNEFKPRGGEGSGGDGAHAVDEVVIHRVHFSREWISELKSLASEGAAATARPRTTLQCVAAHLWRCITVARGLDGHATTRMRIAVNGRARMKDVPAGYTGNVVLWAWPTTTARELLEQPIRATVELISRVVALVDDGYFRSFIDFASSGAVEEERLVPTADSLELTLSPNVEVDSLLGIPFYEMDFGGGSRPFFFVPGYSTVPVDGFVYILQSFEGNGSVDAYVPLFGRAMDAFKKCCYSLMTPMADDERLV